MAFFSLEIPLTWHKSDSSGADHRPVIVFVHNWGGSNTNTKHHAALCNELGFHAVTFSLSFHGDERRLTLPWQLIMRWSCEIEQVLNQVAGQKILFAFSGPSATALHCLAKRYNQNIFDVSGIITDSGPFYDAKGCTRRMIEEIYGIHSVLPRELLLSGMMFLWGTNHNQKLKKSLSMISQIKSDLPFLSIRGSQDTIVPLKNIDDVFQDQPLKNLKIVILNGGHMTALKEQPEEYRKYLGQFLSQWNLI